MGYWGFQHPGVGTISLSLKGSGTLTLDYGNAWGSGMVTLLMDGKILDVAHGQTPSKTVTLPFQDKEELVIQEDPTAVIVVNRISFQASGPGTPSPPPAPFKVVTTDHKMARSFAKAGGWTLWQGSGLCGAECSVARRMYTTSCGG